MRHTVVAECDNEEADEVGQEAESEGRHDDAQLTRSLYFAVNRRRTLVSPLQRACDATYETVGVGAHHTNTRDLVCR